LDTNTPAGLNRPLDLGGSRTRQRLTINGELPLNRRAEAIQYRTALIGYQRERRALQASEDFILSDVRAEIRQLRVLAENYRIQQRAVAVAYSVRENSELSFLEAPPIPGAGAGQAGNAAALTQQLLNAQNSLVQAQNQLFQIWTDYLIARMRLYRDLELLPLDPRGVWIDECTSPPGNHQPSDPAPGERQRPGELPAPRPAVALPGDNRAVAGSAAPQPQRP
jgi:hypothetical protein